MAIFTKPRVLILDDDPDQLLLIGRSLRAEGFDVEMVTSAIGFTNTARKLSPDVVILDVNVPALSGDRLVEALRRQQSNVRIVLYSGEDASTLRKLAADTGADAWFQKGTPMPEIVRKLRRLCDEAARHAANNS